MATTMVAARRATGYDYDGNNDGGGVTKMAADDDNNGVEGDGATGDDDGDGAMGDDNDGRQRWQR